MKVVTQIFSKPAQEVLISSRKKKKPKKNPPATGTNSSQKVEKCRGRSRYGEVGPSSVVKLENVARLVRVQFGDAESPDDVEPLALLVDERNLQPDVVVDDGTAAADGPILVALGDAVLDDTVQHDDRSGVLLPDHQPEVPACVFEWTLAQYVAANHVNICKNDDSPLIKKALEQTVQP
jgi:hypothetical protein